MQEFPSYTSIETQSARTLKHIEKKNNFKPAATWQRFNEIIVV